MSTHEETSGTGGTGGAGEDARQIWREAKDLGRSAVNAQQRAAADGIDDLAGSLRRAARDTGDPNATGASMTESVAKGLERVSANLRERDFDSLVRDIEDFARAQPLVFFTAAVATGFIAMRFLKSSRRGSDDSGESIRSAYVEERAPSTR